MSDEEEYSVEYYYDMVFITGDDTDKVYDGMEPNFKNEIQKFGLNSECCEFFADDINIIVVEVGNQTVPDDFFKKIADQYKVEFVVHSSRYINGDGGIYAETCYKPGGDDE